jgi:hypothetical protein
MLSSDKFDMQAPRSASGQPYLGQLQQRIGNLSLHACTFHFQPHSRSKHELLSRSGVCAVSCTYCEEILLLTPSTFTNQDVDMTCASRTLVVRVLQQVQQLGDGIAIYGRRCAAFGEVRQR